MFSYKRYGKNEDLYQTWSKDSGPCAKVIIEGDLNGRHFAIVSHHTGQPNAYLQVFEDDAMAKNANEYEDYDGNLSGVHGGSTYYGKAYWDENDRNTYVGWDYGHNGDYCERFPKWGGRKWTIIEILMEIAVADYEINVMNNEDYYSD